MKTIQKIIMSALALPFVGAGLFTSCTEVESSLVEYVEDNELDDPNDTVFSFVGIMGKMQNIADRTILLGELRSDLVVPTDEATTDIYDLAMFKAGINNQYNKPSDYYAIIQNCNYYLAHVDTVLSKRGYKVFEKEIAAVKAYRAWVYLQLAANYGEVPFVTEPILREKDADPELYPKYDVKKVADYFIADLAPCVDTPFPDNYGYDALAYIPVRVLLADLNLWAGNYEQAARLYFEYLNDRDKSDYHAIGTERSHWVDYRFEDVSGSPSRTSVATIRLNEDEFDGVVGHLSDVFESTINNSYYFQVKPSAALGQLSRSQRYTLLYQDPLTFATDTITPPDTLVYDPASLQGDLRLYSCYTLTGNNTSNDTYSKYMQTISKVSETTVVLYTVQQIYLRYAEALNLAGYPQFAFGVLKYGLYYNNLNTRFTPEEVASASHLVNFNQYNFTNANTFGIHARGCGDCHCDTLYAIPSLPTLDDSIKFVENTIIDEMALETAFEGMRYQDLLRYALRHNDTDWFATKVASRGGTLDSDLYTLLSDRKNWFLPLPGNTSLK